MVEWCLKRVKWVNRTANDTSWRAQDRNIVDPLLVTWWTFLSGTASRIGNQHIIMHSWLARVSWIIQIIQMRVGNVKILLLKCQLHKHLLSRVWSDYMEFVQSKNQLQILCCVEKGWRHVIKSLFMLIELEKAGKPSSFETSTPFFFRHQSLKMNMFSLKGNLLWWNASSFVTWTSL
jgi:hypothetical protein